MKLDTILVPLDGSSLAEGAVARAAELAVGADLIVMMTHGRSGLGRLVMGSVAESVVRGTTTPILLLRDGGAPVEAPAGTAAAAPCST